MFARLRGAQTWVLIVAGSHMTDEPMPFGVAAPDRSFLARKLTWRKEPFGKASRQSTTDVAPDGRRWGNHHALSCPAGDVPGAAAEAHPGGASQEERSWANAIVRTLSCARKAARRGSGC
jgi:hypothetical protein